MLRDRVAIPVWLVAAIILGATLLGGAAYLMLNRSKALAFNEAPTSTPSSTQFNETFAPVVKSAAPAVVNISTSRIVRTPDGNLGPLFDDPFFRRFFGERPFGVPRERRERSLGSGVIVTSDGYVLTNSHVVQDATDIQIFLTDDRQFSGHIVGTDPKTDLALVKLDQNGLTTLPLADSSKVEVGDVALAIGNPFGIGTTVTMGIVSATGRGNLGIEEHEDFIQTDAATNPGNSGGALINVHGQLVGINTAILSPTGGNLGIGFAIPSNMARHVMDQILEHGKVKRGWLGVTIQPITSDLAAALNLTSSHGALISDVAPESPAARAGLIPGDAIVEVNEQAIEASRQLQLLIGQSSPGRTLNLRIIRNGRQMDVVASLSEEPAPVQRSGRGETPELQNERQAYGNQIDSISVTDINPTISRRLGLPLNTRGVVITEIDETSATADSGLRPGDVIQEVNRQPVSDVTTFQKALNRSKEPVLLLINRGGAKSYVALKREAHASVRADADEVAYAATPMRNQ
jgi:serine protease Do